MEVKPLMTQQALDFAHLLDTEHVNVVDIKARVTKPEILKEGGEDDSQVFLYTDIEIYARILKEALREYAAITLEKESVIQEIKLHVTHSYSNVHLYSMTIHPKTRDITIELGMPNAILTTVLDLCRTYDIRKIDVRSNSNKYQW